MQESPQNQPNSDADNVAPALASHLVASTTAAVDNSSFNQDSRDKKRQSDDLVPQTMKAPFSNRPMLTSDQIISTTALLFCAAILSALLVVFYTKLPPDYVPIQQWNSAELGYFWSIIVGIFGLFFFWLLVNLRDRIGPILAFGSAVTGGLASGALGKGFYEVTKPIPILQNILVGAMAGVIIATLAAFFMRKWAGRLFGEENSRKRTLFYTSILLILPAGSTLGGTRWPTVLSCVAVSIWGTFFMATTLDDAGKAVQRGVNEHEKWRYSIEITVAAVFLFVSFLRFGKNK